MGNNSRAPVHSRSWCGQRCRQGYEVNWAGSASGHPRLQADAAPPANPTEIEGVVDQISNRSRTRRRSLLA